LASGVAPSGVPQMEIRPFYRPSKPRDAFDQFVLAIALHPRKPDYLADARSLLIGAVQRQIDLYQRAILK
jgi:hypothetical protein